MPPCDSAIEVASGDGRDVEFAPLIEGLRELMRHADNLRSQEERTTAARSAFGLLLAELRVAVEIYTDPMRVEALMESLRDAAYACIEEARRLHDQGASVHTIVADLNQQLGEALGQSLA